jgi:hypothetical protein
MLNVCIYQQLAPTSLGVCHTIFRETIVVLAQELYGFCNALFLRSNTVVCLKMV